MSARPIHTIARYDARQGADLDTLLRRMEQVAVLDRELHLAGHVIHKEDGLYDAFVLPDLQLWQILYEPPAGIDRDAQLLLQMVIDRTVPASLEALEQECVIAELGPWAQDCARSVDDFKQWLSVLREQLKAFRGDPVDFFAECRIAFPEFIFSDRFPRCLHTFDGAFADFSSEVAAALISLAEDMSECMKQATTYESMRAFTAASGYETSMEGNVDRKGALTFQFFHNERAVQILCEPHIKLHRSARAGDTKHYFHRIYFSTADHEAFPAKTLIGHIGEHL